MRVWSLFHYRSYGAFFLQQNRLHNSYGGFTHYRNYRAKVISCHEKDYSHFKHDRECLVKANEVLELLHKVHFLTYKDLLCCGIIYITSL